MSLFPAYGEPRAREPSPEAPEPQAAPPPASTWLSNASFKPAPEPEVHELSSSDSSEPRHVAEVSGTRKRKKKKRRKEEREPKKVAKPPPTVREKWSFAQPSSTSLPSTSFVLDQRRDIENLQFVTMYERHTAKYRYPRRRPVLGPGDRGAALWPLIYLEGKSQASLLNQPRRYFKRRRRKAVALEVGSLGGGEPEELGDSVALVEEATLDDEGRRLVYDPKLQMYRPVEAAEAADEELSATELSQRLNARLGKAPSDARLWLRFVALQDAVSLEMSGQKVRGAAKKAASGLAAVHLGARKGDKELLERKLAILERAIALNPRSLELRSEKIRVGGAGLWEPAELEKEWKKLEFAELNSPRMWQAELNWLAGHFRLFSVPKMLGLFQRCLQKLVLVMGGKIATHPCLPDTEAFVVSVLLQRSAFLAQAGFPEKAVASLQAAVEFNFAAPPGKASDGPLPERRRLFEAFWDSGRPRFGEDGAKGWAASAAAANAPVNPSQAAQDVERRQAELDALEEGLVEQWRAAEGADEGSLWLALEGLREGRDWRPLPVMVEAAEDLERLALPEDVLPSLIPVQGSLNRFRLLQGLLRTAGAFLPDHLPNKALEQIQEPVFRCDVRWTLAEFPLLPQPHFPPRDGGEAFLRGLFRACEGVYRTRRDEAFRLYFAAAWLRHSVKTLALDPTLSPPQRLHRFKGLAKELLKEPENRSATALYAAFAEGLAELGGTKEAADTARAALVRVQSLWANPAASDLPFHLALLRLLAQDPASTSTADLLGHVLLQGALPTKGSESLSRASLVRARQRASELMRDGLLPGYEAYATSLHQSQLVLLGWVGSPLVQTATLASRLLQLMGAKDWLGPTDEARQAVEAPELADVALARRDAELLTEARVRLLREASGGARSGPSLAALRSECGRAVQSWGGSVWVARSWAETGWRGRRGGLGLVELGRQLDAVAEGRGGSVPLPLALARLEVEEARRGWRSAVLGRPVGAEGLRESVETLAGLGLEGLEALWRLRLEVERRSGEAEAAERAFVEGVGRVPWSKALHHDLVRAKPAALPTALDLLAEKMLRLRLPLEELQLLATAERIEEDPAEADGSEATTLPGQSEAQPPSVSTPQTINLE